MAAERPIVAPEPQSSGVHRLELLPEPDQKPSLKTLDVPPGRTPPAPGTGDIVPTDLGAPELYLNRELTYLNFCWRVLHEAEDERIPMLERVKFVGIVSSNVAEL